MPDQSNGRGIDELAQVESLLIPRKGNPGRSEHGKALAQGTGQTSAGDRGFSSPTGLPRSGRRANSVQESEEAETQPTSSAVGPASDRGSPAAPWAVRRPIAGTDRVWI